MGESLLEAASTAYPRYRHHRLSNKAYSTRLCWASGMEFDYQLGPLGARIWPMPTARIDNRKDLLLLLLYSPGRGAEVNESVVGRTRLVKMLFLFKREALKKFQAGTAITEENFYEFFPWKFGPYSQQVFDDLEFFRLRGFIEPEEADEEALPESAAEWQEWLSSSGVDPDDDRLSEYREQVYSLTNKGVVFTERLYGVLSSNQKKMLREFKKRATSAPLRALLKYVYENYPDQTTRSEIKEQMLDS